MWWLDVFLFQHILLQTKVAMSNQIFVIHAVNEGSNNCEVFDALWWACIRDVDYHLNC